MSTLWEDIKRAVKDGYITAAGKTEELTKIGKTRLDIASLKRKMEKKFNQLGSTVYRRLSDETASEEEKAEKISTLVKEIQQLEQDIRENEKKIETIKAEEREKMNQRKSQQ